ncbi:MAG: 1-acyl-sn-glycerol-3-phosphate acyltransferase, partial [Deltaproteobacteria bacterium]|nr:1-acyl-sn-glycerol-3-phosphate acyltransferase [Deltaproteobacteria bacterium]
GGKTRGRAVRILVWLYGRAWSKLLAFFVPMRLEHCDRALPKPCILVPNHQSFFDTYCFGFLPEPDIIFAVRAWPFRMPFYGPYMRWAEYLDTESASSGELLLKAKALLEQGASIAVFPEGTRSPEGTLRRFHAGAFRLAVETGAPLAPVCIDGTGTFLRRNGFLLRPACIKIRVLAPLWPKDFAEYGEEAPLVLRRTVKKQMQQALDDLRGATTPDIPAIRQKECI